MLDGTVDDERRASRAAEVIASEARRLERLVADLLDLARLDTHQFSLRPQPIDARDVVEEAVDALPSRRRPTSGSRSPIDGRGAEPAPAVADPQRVAQIVANLVENALKYASTAVTVGVSEPSATASRSASTTTVRASRPTTCPHVFERLYTSRTVPGRIVGTGIGLAIVHELAVTMGGDARRRTDRRRRHALRGDHPRRERSNERVGPALTGRQRLARFEQLHDWLRVGEAAVDRRASTRRRPAPTVSGRNGASSSPISRRVGDELAECVGRARSEPRSSFHGRVSSTRRFVASTRSRTTPTARRKSKSTSAASTSARHDAVVVEGRSARRTACRPPVGAPSWRCGGRGSRRRARGPRRTARSPARS